MLKACLHSHALGLKLKATVTKIQCTYPSTYAKIEYISKRTYLSRNRMLVYVSYVALKLKHGLIYSVLDSYCRLEENVKMMT